MKEEEKIIKNTIKRTKEYDRTLSPYACKTSECQKLRKEESEHEEFDIRWPFEEDIDRILYCKSYQRYFTPMKSPISRSFLKTVL